MPGPPAGQARPRKAFLVHPWPPARHQASPQMPPAPKALEMSDKLIDAQGLRANQESSSNRLTMKLVTPPYPEVPAPGTDRLGNEPEEEGRRDRYGTSSPQVPNRWQRQ